MCIYGGTKMNGNEFENVINDSGEIINEKSDVIAAELKDAVTSGIYSVLFRRVNDVRITDMRIAKAFENFVGLVDCGSSFTLADMMYSAESVIKGFDVFENAGSEIYCFDSNPAKGYIPKNLLKYSVSSIYALLNSKNGLILDFGAIGENITAGELKRFALIPPKKAGKLRDEAAKAGLNFVRCGTVSSQCKYIISYASNYASSFDKPLSGENTAITVGNAQFRDYLSAYNAVCSYYSCSRISGNNVLRFGLGGSIESVFARILGYFDAMVSLKTIPVTVCFTKEESCNVAVIRPTVADGDYLYFLRVRCSPDGIPDKAHHGQLNYYITDRKKNGIIKNVLPVRENVDRIIARLCTDELKYVSLADVPADSFGIIVSVGRGESVNGIKLGYFTYNE